MNDTFGSLPGAGLPQDRLARLAARRAFVELKQDFIVATAGLPGLRGEWLRERVRRAEDPYALWKLRHSLFAALGGNEPEACTIRHALKSGLDSIFTEFDSSLLGRTGSTLGSTFGNTTSTLSAPLSTTQHATLSPAVPPRAPSRHAHAPAPVARADLSALA